MSETSSEEPFFIQQAEVEGGENVKRNWFNNAGKEAHAEGMTFFRASYHPDNTNLLLFEGWKNRPQNQGEPRWSLTEK